MWQKTERTVVPLNLWSVLSLGYLLWLALPSLWNKGPISKSLNRWILDFSLSSLFCSLSLLHHLFFHLCSNLSTVCSHLYWATLHPPTIPPLAPITVIPCNLMCVTSILYSVFLLYAWNWDVNEWIPMHLNTGLIQLALPVKRAEATS